MLELFRSFAKSWAAKILLALVVVALLGLGATSNFSLSVGRSVGSVGGQAIDAEDYDRAVRRQLFALRGRFPNLDLTPEMLLSQSFDQNVFTYVAQGRAVAMEMSDLGFAAPDNAVAAVRAQEVSQQMGGRPYSKALYDDYLGRQRLRAIAYEDSLRDNISRETLLGVLAEGLAPPADIVQALVDHASETREISYFSIGADQVEAPAAPTDEDIAAHYEAEIDDFTAPEFRAFSFLLISPDKMAEVMEIPEEDLRAEYDARLPQKRDADALRFADREAADAAYARIQEGETFAALAEETPDMLQSFSFLSTEEPFVEYMRAVRAAAFGLEEPSVAAPVTTQLGAVIVNLREIVLEEDGAFEDSRDALRQELALERARRSVEDTAYAAEELLVDGMDYAAVAERLDLVAGTVAQSDANGQTYDGSEVADLPRGYGVLEQTFALSPDDEPGVLEGKRDSAFFLTLDDVTDPAPRPLDEVRDAVAEAYVTAQSLESQRDIADAVRDEIASGAELTQIAADRSWELQQIAGLTRRDVAPTPLSQDMMTEMFAAEQGAPVVALSGDGAAWIVAATTDVGGPPAEQAAQMLQATLEQRAQQLAREQTSSVIQHVASKYDIRFNRERVAQIAQAALSR